MINQRTREIWAPVPISEPPALVKLRDIVVKRSHERLPKWSFRAADDLIIQLQPRPGERRDRFALFRGTALIGTADLPNSKFPSRDESRQAGLACVGFVILPNGLDGVPGWHLKPKNFSFARGTHMQSADDRAEVLKAAVCVPFENGTFDELRPELMFRHSCMICGRVLIDQGSMARMIGPECAGTTSLDAGLLEVLGNEQEPGQEEARA